MKLTKISLALITLLPTLSMAAALDRGGQQIGALFEKGNYANVRFAYVMPEVTGKDVEGSNVADIAKDYGIAGADIKFATGDNGNTAFMLKYDRPWGVNTEYNSGILNGTKGDIKTNAISPIIGYKTKNNMWFYGGLSFEQMKGQIVVQRELQEATAANAVVAASKFANPQSTLTPEQVLGIAEAYKADSTVFAANDPRKAVAEGFLRNASLFDYSGEVSTSTDVGYLVGVAYEIPDIALRADLTYHTATEHNAKAQEYVIGAPNQPESTLNVKFPQSVNLNFQTGIMADTLFITEFRWVDWSQFKVEPPLYKTVTTAAGAADPSLVNYSKDQYKVSAGIGRRFNDKFAARVMFTYDTGTGKPYTNLGPYDDQKGIGIAGTYKASKNLELSLGAQYIMLGDATTKNILANGFESKVIDFTDNKAIVVGTKLAYRF